MDLKICKQKLAKLYIICKALLFKPLVLQAVGFGQHRQ